MVVKKTQAKVSHRDCDAALNHMVNQDRIKIKRSSKVFYSPTENAVREDQHNLLGVDKRKERLRSLHQLLFFYEIGKCGERHFTHEEDFNRFLESVGLSLQDLKPSKTVEISEDNARLTLNI